MKTDNVAKDVRQIHQVLRKLEQSVEEINREIASIKSFIASADHTGAATVAEYDQTDFPGYLLDQEDNYQEIYDGKVVWSLKR